MSWPRGRREDRRSILRHNIGVLVRQLDSTPTDAPEVRKRLVRRIAEMQAEYDDMVAKMLAVKLDEQQRYDKREK